jgi:hypothetical protein
MPEDTPTNQPNPNVDILKMTGFNKSMNLDKMYNLHQGITPENPENGRPELGATAEAPESA